MRTSCVRRWCSPRRPRALGEEVDPQVHGADRVCLLDRHCPALLEALGGAGIREGEDEPHDAEDGGLDGDQADPFVLGLAGEPPPAQAMPGREQGDHGEEEDQDQDVHGWGFGRQKGSGGTRPRILPAAPAPL